MSSDNFTVTRSGPSALRINKVDGSAAPLGNLTALVGKLAAAEFIGTATAAYATSLIYYAVAMKSWTPSQAYSWSALLIAGLVLLVSLGFRHYVQLQTQPVHRFLWTGIGAVALAFSFFLSTLFLLKATDDYSREFLQWRQGDAIILAEANVLPETDMEYFGRAGDRMHMMFNFQVNQNLFFALAAADARPLAKALRATKVRPATAQWGLFLRNHDELDLGRLSQEQREAVFEAFGPEPRMQLYDRGIRRRLAPMLDGDRRRIELAYSLMFTLPGTPVLRYGDELGMGDDLNLPERKCARTPMHWSTEPNAGFTKSDKPLLPVIKGGPFGYEHVNAAMQRRDPNSMLNWTERIIRMRKEVPEVGWGDFEIIQTHDQSVLAMRYDWRNNSVLFVHNLAAQPREIVLSTGIAGEAGRLLVNLLSEDHSRAETAGKHRLLMEAYGYRWYRVGGLDYLLKRSDIDIKSETSR